MTTLRRRTLVAATAGLALVGAGLLPDTTALESLSPTLDRFEPRIPPAEAAALRASWRTFAAATLNLYADPEHDHDGNRDDRN